MEIKGKRVLVTGAGGFIGGRLTEKLLANGAWVTALISARSNSFLKIENPRLKVLRKDILEISKDDLEDIEIVLHLAALTDLGECLKNPKKAYEVNVLGTIHLLEISKNIEKFIYVSTLGVYGNPINIPSKEDDPTFPIEPYAASKLAAESFVSAYCSSINLPFCVARLFNVYGPGQNEKFIIPRIITQAIRGDEINLRNIDTTRDFIYIYDVVDALIKLSTNGKGTYNIGTGVETSVKELIDILEKILNKKLMVKISNEPKTAGVSRSKADSSKIEREIGWKYSVSLQEGLKMTLDYYENG